ncbi:MAG TPA: DUF3616 domain-containing protein [Rhizobiales bacterium]|nr:DUF3616 domain-containing protein [Hyphomicrobiales bacterium]
MSMQFARVLAFVLALAGVAHAAGKLAPAPVRCDRALFDGREKYNQNLSGAVCFPAPGGSSTCYVISDERTGLQQISVSRRSDGSYACRAGRIIARNKGLPCLRGKKAERDFEGIASDGRNIYITGSWGNTRKKNADKAPERWVLVRQPIDATGQLAGGCQALTRKTLKGFVKSNIRDLYPFVDSPLQCGGLNIEGLTARAGKLLFGLRSPSNRRTGLAFVFEADTAKMFAGQTRAAGGRIMPLLVPYGKTGVGVRALETLPDGRVLVVTGNAGVSTGKLSSRGKDNVNAKCNPPRRPYYRNTKGRLPAGLWLWNPATGNTKGIGAIAGKYGGRKLEGVALLSQKHEKVTLLLVFDDVDNDRLSPLAVIQVVLP